MTSLKYGWPFLGGGSGGANTGGERAKGEDAKARRKDPVRGPHAEMYGSAYARAYSQRRVTGEGGAFLFPGDIYLGAGGRRGPHFA